ncbi:MAG: hypothetical protein SFV51_06710 [Bryobacteraceae bacterium]|nr:hypothetical protein [Bryobacteraceae bacterium]
MPTETLESALSVNRRAPDMEDYIDIIRRHKAWIFGPLFAGLVISVVVAHLWPDTYISTAVVRVVPPQVPEAFVPQNINMEMSQRINSMAQQILSRSTLTNIINTYGLYPRERARLPMEDVVEEMRRKDVRISNVVNFATATEGRKTVPAFQISFAYLNRGLAQKVCQDLVGRFITENTRDRSNASNFTTQFLKDQLEQARKELEGVEDKLARFRIDKAGQLPDQVQQNLQQLNALEQRASNLNGIVSRLNQERLLTESELRINKDRLSQLSATSTETVNLPQTAARNERLAALENEVMRQEAGIAALKENYRETHPDVQRAEAVLASIRRNRDALKKEEATKKPDPGPQTQTRTVTNPLIIEKQKELEAIIKRLQSAMEAKDLEMEDAKRQLAMVQAQIGSAQGRLNATPLSEKEYMDFLRERDLVRQRVEDLNKKQALSRVATELENRQQGENLELLDPASLPMKPSEPNRPMIIGVGTAIGFLLGLFFAGARELKDTSLKNLKDVRAYTQLNILGSIPLLENDLVMRRRRRLSWLAWSTASIVGVMVMSASVYYYYFVAHV